ncbi:hypothetical protein Vafri_18981 [Volvox africanus]|uniref:Uncharacterized protein n=1 Tax=Volvox africanus TaxID=51714 RepID=A0A8J4BTS2_9CHLO|nr:hypothetical protein Vafri_18981 [Volvox africanus]
MRYRYFGINKYASICYPLPSPCPSPTKLLSCNTTAFQCSHESLIRQSPEIHSVAAAAAAADAVPFRIASLTAIAAVVATGHTATVPYIAVTVAVLLPGTIIILQPTSSATAAAASSSTTATATATAFSLPVFTESGPGAAVTSGACATGTRALRQPS